jgi:plasmid stabilization system protein ParE
LNLDHDRALGVRIRIVIRRSAAADIAEAHSWYEAQRAGLGTKFLDEVEWTLERVGTDPSRFPIVFRDARRALVRRFPYAIYFRLAGDRARVLAVVHQSRDPRTWKQRLQE